MAQELKYPKDFNTRSAPLTRDDKIQFQDATGDWQRPLSDIIPAASPLFKEVFKVESKVITSIYCNNPDGSIFSGGVRIAAGTIDISYDYSNYIILTCGASFLPEPGFKQLSASSWVTGYFAGNYRLRINMGEDLNTQPLYIAVEYAATPE